MWQTIVDLFRAGRTDDAALALLLVGTGVLGVVGIICVTIYKVAELFA